MLIPYSQILEKYNFKPSGILHLGAHQAEESDDYQKSGVENVIWVEGNPELMPILSEKLKIYPRNRILNLIVSDTDNQEITLNITNSTMSSSILDLAEHKVQHPGIDVVKNIQLKTTRLDSFINSHSDLGFSNLDFLNIDIQGAELLALKGLGNYIEGFKFIYTEINLANLYDGCPLLEDLDFFLGNKGFKRVETAVTEWLWGDALYFKTEMSENDIKVQVEDAKSITKKYLQEDKSKKNALIESNRKKANSKKIRNIAKKIPYLKKLVLFLRKKEQVIPQKPIDLADISTNGEIFFIETIFLKYKKGTSQPLVLFDVGANMGLYTEMLIDFCNKHQFDYQIHLFEPQPFCFEHLQVKFKNDPKCFINNCALSDSEEDTILYTDTDGSPMTSMFDRKNLNLSKKQTIKTKTFKNYISEHKIDKIDLLKINVEGNELAVIKGAEKSIFITDFIQFEYGGTYLDSNTKLEEMFNLLQNQFEIGKIMDNEVRFAKFSADFEDYQYANYIGLNKSIK